MSDDVLELKERISKLSDDQLIDMITVSAGDYRQEALDYAKAELKYRRVEWSQPKPEEPQVEADHEADSNGTVVTPPGVNCLVCGGRLRQGTLVAEKELTIIFGDNREERFVRVMACVQCGQMSLTADYDTDVERP